MGLLVFMKLECIDVTCSNEPVCWHGIGIHRNIAKQVYPNAFLELELLCTTYFQNKLIVSIRLMTNGPFVCMGMEYIGIHYEGAIFLHIIEILSK